MIMEIVSKIENNNLEKLSNKEKIFETSFIDINNVIICQDNANKNNLSMKELISKVKK